MVDFVHRSGPRWHTSASIPPVQARSSKSLELLDWLELVTLLLLLLSEDPERFYSQTEHPHGAKKPGRLLETHFVVMMLLPVLVHLHPEPPNHRSDQSSV